MLTHLICFSIAAMTLGGATLAAASEPDNLTYVDRSTTKVCQLTGDFDLSQGVPTLSQTGKRFGIEATDLGSSFEHKGKLYFLFGDTWGRPGDRDFIAWSTARSPENILLDCWMAPDGKWSPLTVPGVSQGAFEVPTAGVSLGGSMYVVVTTDHSEAKTMGRSVMTVSEDDGKTFWQLYDISTTKFINVSYWPTRDWLYIFGSGDYRKSSVCLARIKPGTIREKSSLFYFTGVSADNKSAWSAREEDAVPLFHHDVVGELSVAYIKPVRQYVMLYNSDDPRGIIMRSARTPWGPWSSSTLIFEPWRDNGYGHFIHVPDRFGQNGDTVTDVNREAEWGAEYGPFIMSRYTIGTDAGCRIYYTMSTWNPYQVVVMQSDLKLQPHQAMGTAKDELP